MDVLFNGLTAMANSLISMMQGVAVTVCIAYSCWKSILWYQQDEHEKKQLMRIWGTALAVCVCILLAKPLLEWGTSFFKPVSGV